MSSVLVVSASLLGLLLIGRYVELLRGGRVLAPVRDVLDRVTVAISRGLGSALRRIVHFFHSDVLMKGLHVLTYAALVCVRFVERRLVRLVTVMRQFRREQELKEPTHKLARAHHERAVHE